MGISQSEFTDPSLSGRINFYTGSGYTTNNLGTITSYGAGSAISPSTPTQASLMENYSTLQNYDVLMLPCQGTPDNNVVAGALGTQELANFIAFANAGGRVYSSHYSYAWMFNNPPFNGVVNWNPNSTQLVSGTATVNTSNFTAGQTLSQWLQLPVINASTSPGQMDLDTLRIDIVDFPIYPDRPYPASYALPYSGDPLDGGVLSTYMNEGEPGNAARPAIHELEVCSPLLELAPGEEFCDTSRVYQVQGDEAAIEQICQRHFNVELQEIKKFAGKTV